MKREERINMNREHGFKNSVIPQTPREYELAKETIGRFLAKEATPADTVAELARIFYEALPSGEKKRVVGELKYAAKLFERVAAMPKELVVATPLTVSWRSGNFSEDFEVPCGDTLYLRADEDGRYFYCQKYQRKEWHEVYEGWRCVDVCEEKVAYRKVFPLSLVKSPKKGISKLDAEWEKWFRYGHTTIYPEVAGEEILLATPEAWEERLQASASQGD